MAHATRGERAPKYAAGPCNCKLRNWPDTIEAGSGELRFPARKRTACRLYRCGLQADAEGLTVAGASVERASDREAPRRVSGLWGWLVVR